MAIGAILYGTWGWTTVGPGERLMVSRLGRFVGASGPGLHLGWPAPFESVIRLAPERVRSIEIGFRTDTADGDDSTGWESDHGRTVTALAEDEALLLTGDGQLVELSATVQYTLDARQPERLRAYAFGAVDPDRSAPRSW